MIALLQDEGERASQPPLSPKDRLGWLNARGHITDSQRTAGDIVMKLREQSRRVAYSSAGSSHSKSDLNALEAKETARKRYERAMSAVTPIGAGVIEAVVIDGLSNDDAGKRLAIHPKAVTPLLKMALEILADHYRVP